MVAPKVKSGALNDVENGSLTPSATTFLGDRCAFTAGPTFTIPMPVIDAASARLNLLVPVFLAPCSAPNSEADAPMFLASPSTRRRVGAVDVLVVVLVTLARLERDAEVLARARVLEAGTVDVEVEATAERSSEGRARGRPDLLLVIPAEEAAVVVGAGRDETSVLLLIDRVMVLGAGSTGAAKVELNGGSELG